MQDDKQAVAKIGDAIRAEGTRLNKKYPLLLYQNTLGLTFFLICVIAVVFVSLLTIQGRISAFVCILINAFFMSILHEIEHDLIHNLYFAKSRVMQNVMLTLVWALRGNIINPWYRRSIHLRHHRCSGQVEDVEERLIGNGLAMGPLRIIVMLDGLMSVLLRCKELSRISAYSFRRILFAGFPFTFLFYAIVLVFFVCHIFVLIGPLTAQLNEALPLLDLMMVVYILPNLLRQACINIISSNMHYFGNVKSRLQEVQILNPWYFLPLQLFCFNFGNTHAIHHFEINQPFYLRQLLKIKSVMLKNGVRYNDLGSLKRANLYQSS